MKTKASHRFLWILFILLLLSPGIFWNSCSGGGGGGTASSPPGSTKSVHWGAPTQFADGGALDPSKDLSSYEIFINETGNFSPEEAPRAISPAVDPSTKIPITSFDLVKISPPLQLGTTYYVAMRAVDTNGIKSVLTLPTKFIY
jgi:hypothetical protein